MSSRQTHVVGQLVTQALQLRRPEYHRGPWAVVNDSFGSSADSHIMRLVHYQTTMLEWVYHWKSGSSAITRTWTGHGSRSDQAGVNSALWALGSKLRYSRDVSGGGPRVNRRWR